MTQTNNSNEATDWREGDLTVRGKELVAAHGMGPRAHVWEPYDRGRLGHAQGQSRDQNPFRAIPWHQTYFDWNRGYSDESDLMAAVDHLSTLAGE
jgi:hypothetical protein